MAYETELVHAEHVEHEGDTHAEEEAPGLHDHGDTDIWLFVLIGVVGLFILESLVFRGAREAMHSSHADGAHDHDPDHECGHRGPGDRVQHLTVGYAVLFGLSVHAFTAGLGLASTLSRPALAGTVFVSIMSHKGVEGFSLTTVFMLAGFGRRKILGMILAFALVTPAGVLLGSLLQDHLDAFGLEVMMALAAGTFLFVALGDLLPEVFHRRIDAAYKVLLLVAGIAVSFLIHL
jgi:zinc transporter ZupT